MILNLKRFAWVYSAVIILLIFTIYFLFKQNYEFLLYTFTIGILIYILYRTDKILNYSNFGKWGFSIWLLAHFLGGSLKINGIKLYDTVLFNITGAPLYILRYDQIIHTFCYLVLAFFIYALVKKISGKNANRWAIGIVAVLAAEGLGAINEIIELLTVVFFNSTGVGDYFNNALDLVFNLIGAIIAVLIANKKN